jgi:hypothetical protein
VTVESLIPVPDASDRHERQVAADAGRAFAALRALDFNDLQIVRLIFAARPLLLLSRPGPPLPRGAFVDTAVAGGWRIVHEVPGREVIAAAVTQPWEPHVVFRGMPASDFLAFDEPNHVKIAWSLGARDAGPGRSVLYTETRAAATDAAARQRFRRYWMIVGQGIRLIRRIALAHVVRQLSR